eukprot:1602117-Rhodomonas_salina.4
MPGTSTAIPYAAIAHRLYRPTRSLCSVRYWHSASLVSADDLAMCCPVPRKFMRLSSYALATPCPVLREAML